ncbi:MAG TPA: hypothetical protein VF189_03615 [Patescibacteria group bacterium]
MKKTKSIKRKAPSKIKLHYIVIFFGLVFLVFGSVKLYQKPHVLGASVYLAEGDSKDAINSDKTNSQSSNLGINETSTTTTASGVSSTETSQVDCVGPDGKHFTTTYIACYKLNHAWNKSDFSFTPLTSMENTKEATHSAELKNTDKIDSQLHKNLQVKIEGHNSKLEINKEGTKVELQVEDGKIVVKAKSKDGTTTNLDTKDALEKLNETLGNEDFKISTDGAHGLVIAQENVQAHTTFPVSVDPTTNSLTITTPSGTKTVTVLPNVAIQHILDARLLTNIQNSTTDEGSGSAQTVALTTQNGQAVFEVNGTSNKKIFGLFPVSFAKQIVVSAESGNIVGTNETLLSKLLESLSF